MKISEWLKTSETVLNNCGIGTARLDCLILLEDTLQKDRAWLLANTDYHINPSQLESLNLLLNRRKRHEPLAYIRQKSEFYGREFYINKHVLEPRPETETMIDCLLNLPLLKPEWRIADVGSGSGAIGITAAIELGSNLIDLLDIDNEAVKVSKFNVDKFTLSINVIKSDLLHSSTTEYDILLCNLPYVPDDFHINLAASHEPGLAIFGGPDGLNVYRRLFKQISGRSSRPLYILSEAMPPQQQILSSIALHAGYKQIDCEDFIQIFKHI